MICVLGNKEKITMKGSSCLGKFILVVLMSGVFVCTTNAVAQSEVGKRFNRRCDRIERKIDQACFVRIAERDNADQDSKAFRKTTNQCVRKVGRHQKVCVESARFACTMKFEPVCGQPPLECHPSVNDCQSVVLPELRTYSNRCVLKVARAEFRSDGECPPTEPFVVITR